MMLDQFIKDTILPKKEIFMDIVEIKLESYSKLQEIQDFLNMFKDTLK